MSKTKLKLQNRIKKILFSPDFGFIDTNSFNRDEICKNIDNFVQHFTKIKLNDFIQYITQYMNLYDSLNKNKNTFIVEDRDMIIKYSAFHDFIKKHTLISRKSEREFPMLVIYDYEIDCEFKKLNFPYQFKQYNNEINGEVKINKVIHKLKLNEYSYNFRFFNEEYSNIKMQLICLMSVANQFSEFDENYKIPITKYTPDIKYIDMSFIFDREIDGRFIITLFKNLLKNDNIKRQYDSILSILYFYKHHDFNQKKFDSDKYRDNWKVL